MTSARVLYNGRLAGILSKSEGTYRFVYDSNYLTTVGSRPISLTLPLRDTPYESDVLFPAFANKLSEGANKAMQNRLLKIDENDYFGLLLATAGSDTIGPISIKELNEPADH